MTNSPTPAGYAHPLYCASLGEHGAPLSLPASGANLLVRDIDGSPLRDAMGPYPLLLCSDWTRLADDLGDLAGDLVSITAVSDPLGGYDAGLLGEAFPDLARPYKEHFVVDLSLAPDKRTSSHHRRNIRRAREKVAVEHSSPPQQWLDEWVSLYRNLADKRRIQGFSLFSRRAFEYQFQVPGLHAFRASVDGAAAGMLLIYVDGSRAYYHLGCYSDEGYRTGAAFALFDTAIGWLGSAGCNMLLLGGGAADSDGTDGLSRFKSGWATGTATAYLCGRILDRAAYGRLCAGPPRAPYFPAYRGDPAPASSGGAAIA